MLWKRVHLWSHRNKCRGIAALVEDVATDLEVFVELVHDGVVVLSVVLGCICGGQDRLCLFSQEIEQCADLLRGRVSGEA